MRKRTPLLKVFNTAHCTTRSTHTKTSMNSTHRMESTDQSIHKTKTDDALSFDSMFYDRSFSHRRSRMKSGYLGHEAMFML